MREVSAIQRKGWDVIWVTSGAIAMGSAVGGAMKLKGARKSRPDAGGEMSQRQALSAIGQPLLMARYLGALGRLGMSGAQILLSSADLEHAGRRKLFAQTVRELLAAGVLPILNENDAVATEEIRFGDNDQLSARVAVALGARRLVMIGEAPGVLSADGQWVQKVDRVTPAMIARSDSASTLGTGGMRSKLIAARLAIRAGIETWVVPTGESRSLSRRVLS